VTDLPLTPGQPLTAGVVYRRIPNYSSMYLYAEGRPASSAFRVKSEDDYLSMSMKGLTTADDMLRGYNGFGLCEVSIEDLVALKLQVTYEPGEGDDAHVAIRGVTKSMRGKIAAVARVVIPPGLPAE
jgi:hypothetical protein